MRLGHPDQSEADYDQAIRLNPEDGWSWLGRGLARKSRGSVLPALSDLAQSVALEPDVPTAWGLIGEIHGGQGRWDGAASDFAHWSALGGDPVAIPWYFHAALRVYANDPAGYRQACKTMWERLGEASDPFVASLAAHACTLGPDPGVAADRIVELAGKAARANPRDGWSVFTLGAALRRAGRLEEAKEKLDEAIRVDPHWIGNPLIAAVRELTERALPVHAGRDPKSGEPSNSEGSSPSNSSALQGELKKTKAAWQYQVEASLLGRELDAGRSEKIEAEVQR